MTTKVIQVAAQQPFFSPQPVWPVIIDGVDFPGGDVGVTFNAATTDAAWSAVITHQLLLYPNQIAVYYKNATPSPYVSVKNWDSTSGYSSNTGAMTFFIPEMRWNALNSSTNGGLVHQESLLYIHRRSDGTSNGTVIEVNSSNTNNSYRINADGSVQSTSISSSYLYNNSSALLLDNTNITYFDYNLFVATGLLRDTDTGNFVIPSSYPATSGTALVFGDTPKLTDLFQFR